MTRISGDQFAQNLTQLSTAVQSADPHVCMQKLQQFGQSMGADMCAGSWTPSSPSPATRRTC